jgi:hypothetical protein
MVHAAGINSTLVIRATALQTVVAKGSGGASSKGCGTSKSLQINEGPNRFQVRGRYSSNVIGYLLRHLRSKTLSSQVPNGAHFLFSPLFKSPVVGEDWGGKGGKGGGGGSHSVSDRLHVGEGSWSIPSGRDASRKGVVVESQDLEVGPADTTPFLWQTPRESVVWHRQQPARKKALAKAPGLYPGKRWSVICSRYATRGWIPPPPPLPMAAADKPRRQRQSQTWHLLCWEGWRSLDPSSLPMQDLAHRHSLHLNNKKLIIFLSSSF